MLGYRNDDRYPALSRQSHSVRLRNSAYMDGKSGGFSPHQCPKNEDELTCFSFLNTFDVTSADAALCGKR